LTGKRESEKLKRSGEAQIERKTLAGENDQEYFRKSKYSKVQRLKANLTPARLIQERFQALPRSSPSSGGNGFLQTQSEVPKN